MNKENLIMSFINCFSKRYPNHSNTSKERTSNLKVIEDDFNAIDSGVAFVSNGAIRFNGSIASYNNEFISYVSFHELFHILSNIFQSKYHLVDNYGYFPNIPEVYILRICNYDMNKFNFLEKDGTLHFFYNFNEACNEFLSNELFDDRSVQYQSFNDSSLFIKTDKFYPCGYDFNVNLLRMLSSVIDIDTILDVHLGNIIFKDFCNDFDSKFSNCLVDSSHEFSFYELLEYMCDTPSDYTDIRTIPENYINASTLIIRAFHKQMANTQIFSLEDLQDLYNKIKNIQDCIAFDLFKNYENRSDIDELRKIETEFLSILSRFPESAEILFMKDNFSFQDNLIDSEKITTLSQRMFNIKDISTTSKKVLGKYIIPQSDTGDQRDFLYAMLYKYSCTSLGVMNCFQNPHFLDLVSLISELPKNPISQKDIESYIKAQDCISSLTLNTLLEKNSTFPYSLKTIEPYYNAITTINDYSIVDSEKGRTSSEKSLRKTYSEIFNPIKNAALASAVAIRNKLNNEVSNRLSKKDDERYIVLDKKCNDVFNKSHQLTLSEDRTHEEI